jgi:hypothetical protein
MMALAILTNLEICLDSLNDGLRCPDSTDKISMGAPWLTCKS